MKKIKLNLIFNSLVSVALILFSTNNGFAQAIDKTIVKSTTIAGNVLVEVWGSNYDVAINTWDKNEVKAEVLIHAEANSNEELNSFLNALEVAMEKQFNSKSGSLKISLPFRKMQQNNQKVEIELENNNKTYHLRKFKASMVINMPKQNNLEAKSSFGKLSIGNLNADATVTTSSSELEMGDCKNIKLNASFTKKMKMGNVENAELKISSSDLLMGEIKNNLNLRASFSGLEIGKIGNKATINLSSSTFETSDIKTLELAASFVRRFKIKNAEKVTMKLSSSEFEAANINLLEINNISFSKLNLDEIGTLKAPGCSSSKFYIKKATSIEVTNSSFSDFYINSLKTKFTTKASSGSIHLTNVAKGFEKIDIDGQFVSIDISVEENAGYLISADLEFPNYNFKEITFQNRNKDLSKETFNGWKGSNKNASSEISFNCKSCNIRLN
ncbi:MAG: hypothetical protein P1P88_15845 [Bacteroidales bacterium]|nr:hypothetical protein [Bacteroidales bacterium]